MNARRDLREGFISSFPPTTKGTRWWIYRRFHIEYTAFAINGRTARLFCDKSERIRFVQQAQFPVWIACGRRV